VVLSSIDQGASWSTRFENQPSEYFERLLPAPSDPQRLYAAGARFTTTARHTLCAVSNDAGEHWSSQVVADGVVPFAVHPSRADVVFAHQNVDVLATRFRVLRSEDGCATFESVLEDGPQPVALTGVPGAGTLWLGFDGQGGLYRSDDDGLSFSQAFVGEIQAVSCIEEHGGSLWLCANRAPNENGVWRLDEAGASLRKLMTLAEVGTPVACEDSGARAACAGPWYDFYSELHSVAPTLDAGAVDGGVADSDAGVEADSTNADGTSADPETDAAPGRAPRAGGGCQLAHACARPSWPSGLALLWMLALNRARRRRPR
jgi:hypothetical protein